MPYASALVSGFAKYQARVGCHFFDCPFCDRYHKIINSIINRIESRAGPVWVYDPMLFVADRKDLTCHGSASR